MESAVCPYCGATLKSGRPRYYKLRYFTWWGGMYEGSRGPRSACPTLWGAIRRARFLVSYWRYSDCRWQVKRCQVSWEAPCCSRVIVTFTSKDTGLGPPREAKA